MHWSKYIVYVAIVGFIRIYKWLELRILLLFVPILKQKGIELAKSFGVILNCLEDKKIESEILSNFNKTAKTGCGIYKKNVNLKVNHEKFFVKIANLGTLGLGEAFMDKTCDVYENNFEDLTEFATRTFENNILDYFYNPWNRLLEWLELYAFNLQTRKRAFQVGLEHYDLGNDLFKIMLDPWMQYTCGYWKDAKNLNDAQLHKMELIAKKLNLKPGMRILDIGCGWGTLCKYLAENYQVECVGITISEEGVTYGKQICKGLPIEIRLQDYRDVNETFDRIVSVGMFEHVGHWNYREFFKIGRNCLVDDGILLLHTIGRNHYNYPLRSDPWSNKYIFPNGQVPSPIDISNETKDLFVIEDWHNFGQDYAKTLFCWRENFLKGWPKIERKYEGDGFFRMWIAYLSFARALFKSRRLQLWQIVLSKDGIKNEYRAVR